MHEEFASPEQPSKPPTPYFRFTSSLSGIVDSFSSAFFFMTYSSLAHLAHTIWCRLTAEE